MEGVIWVILPGRVNLLQVHRTKILQLMFELIEFMMDVSRQCYFGGNSS